MTEDLKKVGGAVSRAMQALLRLEQEIMGGQLAIGDPTERAEVMIKEVVRLKSMCVRLTENLKKETQTATSESARVNKLDEQIIELEEILFPDGVNPDDGSLVNRLRQCVVRVREMECEAPRLDQKILEGTTEMASALSELNDLLVAYERENRVLWGKAPIVDRLRHALEMARKAKAGQAALDRVKELEQKERQTRRDLRSLFRLAARVKR